MKIKHMLNICVATLIFPYSNLILANNKISSTEYLSCYHNNQLQSVRSKELIKLVNSDQSEREKWATLTDSNMMLVAKNDLIRRKRVGEIFAEGCLKTSSDYMAAALIYQHGDVPNHYYQAFIWANQASILGDKSANHLASLAIDRYLVSSGKKQLFGSQWFSSGIQNPNKCFCMKPVEKSFPDIRRINYSGRSLQKSYEYLASLNKGKNCPEVDCTQPLASTPKGSIPGFW